MMRDAEVQTEVGADYEGATKPDTLRLGPTCAPDRGYFNWLLVKGLRVADDAVQAPQGGRELAPAMGDHRPRRRRSQPSDTTLKVVNAFLKEVLAEELKRVHVLGGTIAALEKLSEEEGASEAAARIERILTMASQDQESLGRIQHDVDALAALTTAVFLKQHQLQDWLEGAGRPVQPAELTVFFLESALLAYRGRVALDYQYADHRGVVGARRELHAVSLPLDDLYVLPRLLPERLKAELHSRQWKLLRMLEDPDLPEERRLALEKEYAALTGEHWQPKASWRDDTIPLGAVLADARLAVLLGEPGTGKSTLVKYIARSCALGPDAMQARLGWAEDLVPVVLPLASFADARSRSPGLGLRAFLTHQLVERGGDALAQAIDEEARAGRLFVLLDGIDEIPVPRERAQSSRQWASSSASWLLTARIVV